VPDRLAALADELGHSLDDVRDLWNERAAVREFDGGLSRAEAEHAAYDDVAQLLRAARRGPRAAGAEAAGRSKAESR
jgi:nitroreductase